MRTDPGFYKNIFKREIISSGRSFYYALSNRMAGLREYDP